VLWILVLAAIVVAFLGLRSGRRVAGAVFAVVAGALFGGAVLIGILGRAYRIPSQSMEPTVRLDDRVIALRLSGGGLRDIVSHNPPAAAETGAGCAEPPPRRAMCARPHGERGDVTYIKRVVAVGGDRIALRGGRVIRNGRPVDEPFRCSGEGCDFPREITVPRGHLYVLGDNRGASDDSRFWGPIPEDWVRGKVVVRYWPPSRAGGL
jgi:signal peptidase I